MWCLETLEKVNAPGFDIQEPHPLRFHPRIVAVRRFVNSLPVAYVYKMRLKRSIHRFADQIIARPVYDSWHGWSDAEAIQQVTLGDWNEENLQNILRVSVGETLGPYSEPMKSKKRRMKWLILNREPSA